MTALTKTRFAPSPTGFIHLGNVRTALFSWLYARRQHGHFLLRIEDTDGERSEARFTEALQRDLRWLGLEWQEGPGADAGNGPYAQSERADIYARYYRELEEKGLAYPCFCSEQQLKLSRKAQLNSGRPPRYAGTCARLSPAEVEAKLAQGLKPTLRFRVNDGRSIEFDDLVRGPQRFKSDDIGDFIIRRADGTAAFFFCNAIDDALMGVTHVLRGEDHITNTPRQILILEAVGQRLPHYGHLPMILGEDGGPLSKRLGGLGVQELREQGYLPLAVNNYLARLGHNYASNEFMSMDQLAEGFDFAQVGRAPARHDSHQLVYWQKAVLTVCDDEALWQWMGEPVHQLVGADYRQAFIALVRANVVFPGEAMQWARIAFSAQGDGISEQAQAVLAETDGSFFQALLDALQQHQTDYKAVVEAVKQATGAKGKGLFQPLRSALTGRLDGPELAALLPLLGTERAQQRVRACFK